MNEHEIDDRLRDALEANIPPDNAHPSDDALRALATTAWIDEASDAGPWDADETAVADHLARCPRCTERALMLAEPNDDAQVGPDHALSDADVSRGVAQTMARIRAPSTSAAATTDVVRPLRPSPPAAAMPETSPFIMRGSAPLWLTAALLILSLGLSARMLRLEQQLDQVRDAAPVVAVDVPILDLVPTTNRRGAPAPATVVLDPTAGMQVVLVTPPTPRPDASATIRILDPSGTTHWQGEVVANRAGSFSLGFPHGVLDAGRYTLELDLSAGEPIHYEIVVSPADP